MLHSIFILHGCIRGGDFYYIFLRNDIYIIQFGNHVIAFQVPQLEPDPPFIGRHWLYKQLLNNVINEKVPGYLLIGNHGTGKTAFLLQLVEQSCFGRGHAMHPGLFFLCTINSNFETLFFSEKESI
jgi:hypothetical protein